jgi:pimeloyl-ACP methyl ester carboxylesterase
MHRGVLLISILLGFAFLAPASSVNQEFSDFTTPLPLKPGNTLILGIVGGWERWDAPQRGVRKTALQLRDMKLPGVYVETVENHKLNLATQLVDRAFPQDASHTSRVIVYGHSLGGPAAVRLAHELDDKGVNVLALVLIDAVGHPRPIPPNVRVGANFFQRDSCPVCGAKSITAEDPARTNILGNLQWKYRDRHVDIHTEPWVRRFFVREHEMMEFDPEMWAEVKKIIVNAVTGSSQVRQP